MLFNFIFQIFGIVLGLSWLLSMAVADDKKRFAFWPVKIFLIALALIVTGGGLFYLWIFVAGLNGLGSIFSLPFVALWLYAAYWLIDSFLIEDFRT